MEIEEEVVKVEAEAVGFDNEVVGMSKGCKNGEGSVGIKEEVITVQLEAM